MSDTMAEKPRRYRMADPGARRHPSIEGGQ